MKRVKKCRLDSDLTQVELAHKIGLNQRVISVLERGFKNEHKEGFRKLCDYFDLDEEEALEEVTVNANS